MVRLIICPRRLFIAVTFGAMFGNIAKIFGKRPALLEPANLSVLKTDVHSHFLPGLDDGSPDLATSLQLLGEMEQMGFRKAITTPHVMSDFYRNTSQVIRAACDQLREDLLHAGLSIELECAAEYYLDAEFRALVKARDLLWFGDKYVLFELPFLQEPPMMAETIFELQLAGYKPVLAHPERYAFWHGSFEKYEQLHEKGVLLQLNINSLTGHYSPQVKRIAERLIDRGMISLIGSDCHHMGHIQLMNDARRQPALHQLLNSGVLLNQRL